MQTMIYRINGEFREEYGDWEHVINVITNNAKTEIREYVPQILKHNISKMSTKLFLCTSSPILQQKLTNFYSAIVEEGQDVLSTHKIDISTLFFVYDDDEMFVIPTGLGYFAIQDFIDSDFGLKIMSSVIDRNSSCIKNMSYKSISGQVAFNTRMFRKEYSLLNEDEFGKLFNEICAAIPKEKFKEAFGLDETSSKKDITCTGKSVFKITKQINANQLFNIILKIKELLKQSQNIFNNFSIVKNKGLNKVLILNLKRALIENIYSEILKKNINLPFDIAHKNYEQYRKASFYEIKYDGKPIYEEKLDEEPKDFQFVLDAIETDVVVTSDVDAFYDFIDKIEIFTYDETQTINLTRGKLFDHLNGELFFENKTYFLIDGNWILLADGFKENLNEKCQEFLGEYYDNSILNVSWPISNKKIKDENAYIDEVCKNDSDCIKVHPNKTSDHIELCDIIKKCKDGSTQLIYIKDGFDHSIRDLTSQVELSQRRIWELQKSDNFVVIEDYYDRIVKSNNGSNLLRLSKKDFVELFKQRKLTFVVAFRPTSHVGYTVKDNPERFNSNIAKYSLYWTIREFKNLNINYDIRICEIDNK